MKTFNRRKIKTKRPKMYSQYFKRYKNSRRKRTGIYHKVARQIALCIIIVILVIIIKHLNLPTSNKASIWIKKSIQKEMDIKNAVAETVKFTKKIPEFSGKAIDVFVNFNNKKKIGSDFLPPVSAGTIVSEYGVNTDPISNRETFQRGIDILVEERLYIQAVKDGKIVGIQESENLGKYIKLQHDKDTFSIYGNCSEILVKKGQNVKQGERIALVYPDSKNKVSHLHFELWKQGKIVDPMDYIQFNKKSL